MSFVCKIYQFFDPTLNLFPKLEFKGTYQTIRLFWSSATSSTEEMATFSRLGSKTPSLVTLWAAIHFRELLTIVSTFAPTARSAGFVTGCAVSLGLVELVVIEQLGIRASDDLLPLDGLDVAQVVVVKDTNTTFQNV